VVDDHNGGRFWLNALCQDEDDDDDDDDDKFFDITHNERKHLSFSLPLIYLQHIVLYKCVIMASWT